MSDERSTYYAWAHCPACGTKNMWTDPPGAAQNKCGKCGHVVNADGPSGESEGPPMLFSDDEPVTRLERVVIALIRSPLANCPVLPDDWITALVANARKICKAMQDE